MKLQRTEPEIDQLCCLIEEERRQGAGGSCIMIGAPKLLSIYRTAARKPCWRNIRRCRGHLRLLWRCDQLQPAARSPEDNSRMAILKTAEQSGTWPKGDIESGSCQ